MVYPRVREEDTASAEWCGCGGEYRVMTERRGLGGGGYRVGGLAAIGLPGGKRRGEIRYRVADIGRRRARQADGLLGGK